MDPETLYGPGRSRRGSHNLTPNIVPTRKGSMVMIDQIPEIIQSSLQSYLSQFQENDVAEDSHPVSMTPRMSIFSTYSRRESAQSDVTFWDPRESLPNLDHYRHVQAAAALAGFRPRPTMYELREELESPSRPGKGIGEDLDDKVDIEQGQDKKDDGATVQSPKMGWIVGVLVRCLLNIFGVMLFLRLTWMTGQAGIGLGSVIILLSSLVTTLTTMSMAAICTNGEVRGGGVYYMISRSLGPEFGGAIGIIFSIANAVAAAMHVVGFAESLRDLIKESGKDITGDNLNDVRLIGCAAQLLILTIVLIGLDFEAKAQLVLLVILTASLVNYFVGTALPPSDDEKVKGFVGYQTRVFLDNFGPDFRKMEGVDHSFFTVFAIYFPSATGILAGANISGDLKNPSSAIPRGTFLAIFLTTTIYLGVVWTSGGSMLRDAIGEALAVNRTIFSLDDIANCANVTCTEGLQNSYQIMQTACAFGPLIYAGIFSATLSSALASMVSAPKVFQALCQDKLFPYIKFFAKPYGKNGEPRRAYILTFLIAVGVTCIGSLDTIAPIISNFFLMAYALVNFACFDAAFANSPGFRPSYRFFNKWLSLVGSIVCVVIMFLIGKWWAALATILVIGALYVYLVHKKPDVNWGSSGQAHTYKYALRFTHRLADLDEHVKNYRPQILVLTGYPRNRPALVDFASCITKRQSLLICGHIFQGDLQRHLRHLGSTAAYRWFRNRGVHAFYTSLASPTLRHGAQVLLQCQGLGKLKPNVLLLGFKSNWQEDNPTAVHNYVGIIHDAFDLHYGVGVLCVPGGFDTKKVSDVLLDATDDPLDVIDSDLQSSDEDEKKEDDEEDEDSQKANKAHLKKAEAEYHPSKLPIFKISEVKEDDSVELKSFDQNCDHVDNSTHINQGYSSDSTDNDSDETNDTNAEPEKEEQPEVSDENGENKQKQVAEKSKLKSALKDSSDHTDKIETNNFNEKSTPTSEANGSCTKIPLEGALSNPDLADDTTGRFRNKQTGTIDIWWLFDDGGLGLLVPYILSKRGTWKKCKLRVFCAGTKHSSLEEDHRRMTALLDKFRIKCSAVTVVPNLHKKPLRSSFKEFERQIYKWRLRPGEYQEDYPWKVSDTDLSLHKAKTYMQIKIREKLIEHSVDAALVVLTLPVPHKFCPAGLYMAWLDTLTRNLPPTLLLRGNQQSVLTFFS